MDEQLRRLRREAADDPLAKAAYLNHLGRVGIINDIERQARLGNQEAMFIFWSGWIFVGNST